jgi:hypothetical protein
LRPPLGLPLLLVPVLLASQGPPELPPQSPSSSEPLVPLPLLLVPLVPLSFVLWSSSSFFPLSRFFLVFFENRCRATQHNASPPFFPLFLFFPPCFFF